MLVAGLVNSAIPAGLCTLLLVAWIVLGIIWLVGLFRYTPTYRSAPARGWYSAHHPAGVAALVLFIIWLLFC